PVIHLPPALDMPSVQLPTPMQPVALVSNPHCSWRDAQQAGNSKPKKHKKSIPSEPAQHKSSHLDEAEQQMVSLERLQARMHAINLRIVQQQQELLSSKANPSTQANWQISQIKRIQTFYANEVAEMVETADAVHRAQERQLDQQQQQQQQIDRGSSSGSKSSRKRLRARTKIRIVSPAVSAESSAGSTPPLRDVSGCDQENPQPPHQTGSADPQRADPSTLQSTISPDLQAQLDAIHADFAQVKSAVRVFLDATRVRDRVLERVRVAEDGLEDIRKRLEWSPLDTLLGPRIGGSGAHPGPAQAGPDLRRRKDELLSELAGGVQPFSVDCAFGSFA
ncbi:hypothetical protein BC831DRAFT_464542, partial [Entophlyctis helioformis]